jgi:hypothetical protein
VSSTVTKDVLTDIIDNANSVVNATLTVPETSVVIETGNSEAGSLMFPESHSSVTTMTEDCCYCGCRSWK